MSYTYQDLQTEVKARAILSESSTNFDTQIKNAINTSIFRVARECKWRVLRRKTIFNTVATYTEGSGAVTATNGSNIVSVVGATFITDGVKTGRVISISNGIYEIASITGETTLTLDRAFSGTSTTTGSYTIFGQQEYVIAPQVGKIATVWHEDYGYPYTMAYVTDSDYYFLAQSRDDSNTPTMYTQWGFTSALAQPLQPGVISVVSSSSSDTSVNVTVYGEVSGYPDKETIVCNGTNVVSGSKLFSSIERATKDSISEGRITVSSDSQNNIISVIPTGDTSAMPEYLSINIFPCPTRVFPIHVLYYKDPSRLISASDIHELGHEFDEAIILLATSKVSYGQDKTVGDKFFALYVDEIKSLKNKNADTIPNWKPNLRRASTMLSSRPHKYLGYGQLGGNYGPTYR